MDKAKFLNIVEGIIDKENVKFESTFEELDMDSTSVIELLIEFEMEYNIDILDDNLNLDDVNTLSDAYDYLSKLLSSK
ncbi:phosphopantetheine-binding protein [Bacillus sp. SM2101]|uniref:phosphopantetheine-binding protein n=1 Tax=Bacillus sp. SM2101 TaxID=2805366 RepID=UPI001BDF542C|nr:phosphopantetheine-binding protein [Bacillus sp. SM2101]